MSVTATNLVQGPATLYKGAFGATEPAGRDHVLLKPVDDLEPLVRFLGLGLVQACLNALLKLRYGKSFIVEIALQQYYPTLQWVHMAIHQARHEHASLQVDYLC